MAFWEKKEQTFPELTAADCLRFYAPLYEVKNPQEPVTSSLYQLEDTTFLQGETSFAKVWAAWCSEGLKFSFTVHKPIEKVSFPDIRTSDSVEIFIDTRDVKTSGFNTKFCHHFYFFPEKVNGRYGAEITRFRTGDAHTLCDHQELKVCAKSTKKHYELEIFIPEHCLNGYDPQHFKKIGFCYRINSPEQETMHFATSSNYKVEENPSLWSTFTLQEK